MDPTTLSMLMQAGGGMTGGLQQILSGIFGRSGAPYQAGMNEMSKYFGQAREAQNPFYNAGTAAIPKYQDWLLKMQDPTKFVNDISSQYSESPFARTLQDSSIRANTNAASMGGLSNGMGGAGIGSTPMTQFAQQNAHDISSQDQNQWLQNILGVNTQYGAGQKGMIDTGQHSADMISQLMAQLGMGMAQGAYGKRAGQETDKMNIINGAGRFLWG